MRTPHSIAGRAVGVAAALTMLAGCSSAGGPLPQPAQPSTDHHATLRMSGESGAPHPDRSPSWINRDASGGALLYVSDSASGRVNVYAYPKGTRAGSIGGFTQPQGLCVDAGGNVWVTDTGTSAILEFAHGGTAPIATLADPGQNPVSCAVSPGSGDLAVANLTTTGGGAGSVAIFKQAAGEPKILKSPSFLSMYFLGYDNAGNLFVDGLQTQSHLFWYAEIRRGHSKFTPLVLTGGPSIRFPGGVQYDGTGMAVGDQASPVIYQTSGATITGSTPLTGACSVAQFFIDGAKVVAPNLCPTAGGNVLFYKYPAGGKATKNLRKLGYPIGAVVSPAS